MPILGYKKHFKNFDSLADDIFIVHFNLIYNSNGALIFNNTENPYFDSGDFNLMLDEVFDNFNKKTFEQYDNGILILSVCKYIVDNVPNLYSITYETKGCLDTYFKNEIIDDYNKISNK